MNNVTTARGETISVQRENLSLKKIQKSRKHTDTVIIETNCGIEIIQGIRAGIIKDAYNRNDYDKHTYHWPVKNGRRIENIVVLCNTTTGDYSLAFSEKAENIVENIPDGYEIEFSYVKVKKGKK